MAREGSGARVGEVLPGRCGETWAGRRAARTGTATGGRGGRTKLRACAGRWELGGGEGGAISRQPAPRGGGLARDSLGRIFWRVGDEGWGCEGRAGRRGGGWVRGRGEGVGWGRRERKRPV